MQQRSRVCMLRQPDGKTKRNFNEPIVTTIIKLSDEDFNYLINTIGRKPANNNKVW